eukprot:TRINITY_DN612_c0_g1_i1.p1 TRINITY_DN612_c0_g1~~TRINITY_DN612_c0_g1_i1.p1  ORF type:complete len:552 (-),score=253.66 TRINITY_DN612_c0_g1_i1:204-1859(-)
MNFKLFFGVLLICFFSTFAIENELNFDSITAVAKVNKKDLIYLTKEPQLASWKIEFQDKVDEESVAIAQYNDTIFVTGWGTFVVNTSKSYADSAQAFAAGLLEGALTANRIWEMWTNQHLTWGFDPQNTTEFPPELEKYIVVQYNWVRQSAKINSPTSTYWRHVNYVFQQMDGLLQGYNQFIQDPSKILRPLDMYMLNAAGDLEDLIPAFSSSSVPKAYYEDEKLTECSALIKIVDNNADIYAGHSTWRPFQLMVRIFKWYNFEFNDNAVPNGGGSVAFSAQPGFLSSKDDFYVIGTKMTAIETTNSIYNETLYTLIKPTDSVLTWTRGVVANRLANDGETWTKIFAQYNSGSYNNQWMILNMKLWQKGQPIPDNFLWIIEQIPGYTRSADVSSILRANNYWGSYNVPYFQDIFNISGYPEMVTKYGNDFTYDYCPRANIFRRDQSKISVIDDMKNMMQFNNWENDPYSEGDPANSIASRYDLRTSHASPFGAVDSKVTSKSLSENLSLWCIAGPTHQQQPIFNWAAWPGVVHLGQPEIWDFDYVFMQKPF